MLNFSSKGLEILRRHNLILEDGRVNKEIKDIAEIKENEIPSFLSCFVMTSSFLSHIKCHALPYEENHITWRNVFKFMPLESNHRLIDTDLFNLLEDKVTNIFNFTCRKYHNLESFDWEEFGSYLGEMLIFKRNYKSQFLDKKLTKYIIKQFKDIEITLIELNNTLTIVQKENAKKLMRYEKVRKTFTDSLWKHTRVHYEKNLNNLLDNLFKYPSKLDEEVFLFCRDKLKEIFDYIYDNQLKPDNTSWEKLGEYLYFILYRPYKTEEIDLPQNLIDYIRNTFEWKRITVRKIDGVYTIVFAESSC